MIIEFINKGAYELKKKKPGRFIEISAYRGNSLWRVELLPFVGPLQIACGKSFFAIINIFTFSEFPRALG
jgi:hypothetical protein